MQALLDPPLQTRSADTAAAVNAAVPCDGGDDGDAEPALRRSEAVDAGQSLRSVSGRVWWSSTL